MEWRMHGAFAVLFSYFDIVECESAMPLTAARIGLKATGSSSTRGRLVSPSTQSYPNLNQAG